MFKGVKQYNLEDHIVFFLENQEGNNLVTHFFLVMAKQNIFHTFQCMVKLILSPGQQYSVQKIQLDQLDRIFRFINHNNNNNKDDHY